MKILICLVICSVYVTCNNEQKDRETHTDLYESLKSLVGVGSDEARELVSRGIGLIVEGMKLVNKEGEDLKRKREEHEAYMKKEKEALEKRVKDFEQKTGEFKHLASDLVHLDVGGKIFKISNKTLSSIPNTFFTKMIGSKKNEDGFIRHSDASFYIERSPLTFEYILDYYMHKNPERLRHLSEEMTMMLYEDASFFQISPIVNHIKHTRIGDSHGCFIAESSMSTLHVTQGNHFSPNSSKILKGIVDVKDNISSVDLSKYESILVTAYDRGIDGKALGDRLADYVDKGGNVITCYPNNAVNSSAHTGGRFTDYHPFKLKSHKSISSTSPISLGKYDKNHPIMGHVNSIKSRSLTTWVVDGELGEGDVKVIASWSDGTPMIAVRYDRPGLVISIGFTCSDRFVSKEYEQILKNALRYRRSKNDGNN